MSSELTPDNMPTVSFIVPVYNAGAHLRECMDSMRHQTMADLEIIAVDDGSTDGSGEALDGLAEEDPRISVLHKENGGVSSARNAALDTARGEWIIFVDSDDWISADMISEVIKAGPDSDIVIFDLYKCVRGAEPEQINVLSFPGGDVTAHRELIELLAISRKSKDREGRGGRASGTCAGKAVRRSLVELCGSRFNEKIIRAEDTVFWLGLFENASAIAYLNKPLYYYRRWKGSITYGARYIPGCRDAFHEILREYMSFRDKYRKDELFDKAIEQRALDILLNNLRHNYANTGNKDPLKKRTEQFRQICESEPYKTAIRHIPFRECRWKILCKFRLYALTIVIYGWFVRIRHRYR